MTDARMAPPRRLRCRLVLLNAAYMQGGAAGEELEPAQRQFDTGFVPHIRHAAHHTDATASKAGFPVSRSCYLTLTRP